MPKTYIVITIGPIVDTLLSARKTRELWASSYLFSYLMRNIVRAIEDKKIGTFLLPSTKYIKERNFFGAGIYPDRIILMGDDKDALNKVDECCKEVLRKTSIEIEKHIKSFAGLVEQYLNSYVRLINLPIELKDKQNIIAEATAYLDAQEQQYPIIPVDITVDDDGLSPLRVFFYKINGSFLYRDGFSDPTRIGDAEIQSLLLFGGKLTNGKLIGTKTRERFLSLVEIATRELKVLDRQKYYKLIEKPLEDWQRTPRSIKDEDRFEGDLLGDLKSEFKKKFKLYHRYVAIVHADGDRIGKMVEKVGAVEDNISKSDSKIRQFSEQLLKYSRNATEIIVKHGGAPVYMGGDDMLFFAPVAFRKKIGGGLLTIFDLIRELDNEFVASIAKYAKSLGIGEDELPTLTFGVSLSYHKFPLYEARNASFDAMQSMKMSDETRNSIKIDFRKHSGQKIIFEIHKKNKKLWVELSDFMKLSIAQPEFLNSFTYKLEIQKGVLCYISNNPEKLHNFFENNFNEVYKENDVFFNKLEGIISELARTSPKNKMEDGGLRLLYGILRFIHFIRSEDKE